MKIKEKFKVVNFLDKCRWKVNNSGINDNYNLINYVNDNISNDTKLLAHWISYITDRQMPYEQIWDIGGFVFSDMVVSYKNNGLSVLEIDNDKSFFCRKDGSKYVFRSKTLPEKKQAERIQRYNREQSVGIEFIPRFYPTDYICMYYTLHTLEFEKFDKNFVKYLSSVIRCILNITTDCSQIIKGLIYGLYILTYEHVGRVKSDELTSINWSDKAHKRTEAIKDLLKNPEIYAKKVKEFYESGKQYKSSKRIMCSLRDYIKSPEFRELFKEELRCNDMPENIINKIFSEEACSYIDLPGDIWNNNSTFRNCLLKNIDPPLEDSEKLQKLSLGELLRLIYNKKEKYGIEIGYPEQFDVTFDLVPRMCKKNNCNICPLSISNERDLDKICVKNDGKFCGIALASCGYKYECKKCDLEFLK